MASLNATNSSFWSSGDFCVYRCADSGEYALGFLKSLDGSKHSCTVVACASGVEQHLSPDTLLALNPDTIKLVTASNLTISSLDTKIDSDYFVQKLGKLASITSGKPSKAYPKSKPPMPVKTSTVPSSISWTVGQMCICMWSEDESYYFGKITQANPEMDEYLVSYCYYNNSELKRSADLHELGSDFELLVEDEFNKGAAKKLRLNCPSPLINNGAAADDVDTTTDKYAALMSLTSELHGNVTCTSPQIPPRRSPAPAVSKPQAFMELTQPSQASSFGDQHPVFPVLPPGISQPPLSSLAALKPPLDIQDKNQAPWQALLISWFMCGYHTGYFEALHSSGKR